MREIKLILPCKAFKIIASRMVEKYQKSFQSHDEDNVVLGNGFDALYNKLLDRNNYLNRPNKRKYEKAETPKKKMKLMANSRVGCPNWLPSSTHAVTENLRDKVKLLLNLPQSDPNFLQYFKDTYALQRLDINSKEIHEMYQEWPVLFTETGILTHFEMLTNINPYQPDIDMKSKKVISFGKQKKLKFSENEDVLMSAIKILGQYFKEDVCKFIYQVKVSCKYFFFHNLYIIKFYFRT